MKLLHVFTDHRETVTHISFSPDSQLIASGDGIALEVRYARSGKPAAGSWLYAYAYDFVFSSDGEIIILGDLTFHCRSVCRESLHHLEGHKGTITAIAISPDGRLLASGDDQGNILFLGVK